MADERNEPPGPLAHLLNDGYSLVPSRIANDGEGRLRAVYAIVDSIKAHRIIRYIPTIDKETDKTLAVMVYASIVRAQERNNPNQKEKYTTEGKFKIEDMAEGVHEFMKVAGVGEVTLGYVDRMASGGSKAVMIPSNKPPGLTIWISHMGRVDEGRWEGLRPEGEDAEEEDEEEEDVEQGSEDEDAQSEDLEEN
jgi:hypothetical protein